ncbi:MAG: DUF3667 domain-containing protein [Bacteroidota bacterium]
MTQKELKPFPKCDLCNGDFSGDFCSQCGKASTLKRINGAYIFSEIASVFNLQKGIFFTIRELMIRPGSSVRQFILHDRKRLVKPINYIILCSLFYVVSQQLIGFQDGYIDLTGMEWDKSYITYIMTWISKNYEFANILLAIFMAFWIKVFFRKYNYNFFEILILLYFVMGTQMLLYTLFGIIEGLSSLEVLDIASLVINIYVCWAIASFFNKRKWYNYLKVFLSYYLGLVSFILIAVLSGYLIDLILN